MINRYEDENKFASEKKDILSKADMSRKGMVDEEIKDIVDIINSKDNYCTTSSCAGRITLLERKSTKKIDAKWLIASHQPVTFKQVKDKLNSEHDAWLMQESCILHVFCRTVETAERFLLACRRSGFKRSGIISLSNKIMIEVMGNEKVETIVLKNGKVLIDDEYLKLLVDVCNTKMRKNRENMGKLYDELKKI